MKFLYHYCSTATFHSIIANQTIRLSSLSMSNDSLEGKMAMEAFMRLAKNDNFSDLNTWRLSKLVKILENNLDGLGFCLSEECDLLSQWRGYSADATGVSIGFSEDYLKWLGEIAQTDRTQKFQVVQVKYKQEEHDDEVKPMYDEFRRYVEDMEYKSRNLDSGNPPMAILSHLFFKLFTLKPHGFAEEREWRLLRNIMRPGESELLYSPLNDRIRPYVEYKLMKPEKEPIIKVRLGPKHSTPKEIVKKFLKQNGFGEVDVVESTLSYR